MSDLLSPQRTERILLQAMQEVLGEQGLRSVFQAARTLSSAGMGGEQLASAILWPEHEPIPFGAMQGSPLFVSCLLAAFEDVYGSLSGRGLALRVGRAAFPYALREYGDDLGLTKTSFRLLPFPSKLKTFSAALARLFNEEGGERVQIEDQDGKLLVHLRRCPLCAHREGGEVVCLLAVGLAEEALYWMSGGKIFQVEEVACSARTDADCTLRIDPAPIS